MVTWDLCISGPWQSFRHQVTLHVPAFLLYGADGRYAGDERRSNNDLCPAWPDYDVSGRCQRRPVATQL